MTLNLKTKKTMVCLLFLFSFLLFHSISFAAPVSVDTAKQVAENWMLQQTGVGHQAIEDSISVSGDYTQDSITPYYIFNMDPEGWVIVSGDDIAHPIIGYSVQGAADPEDAPPAFIEWMAQVEKDIRAAVNNDPEPLLSTQTAWEGLDVAEYELSSGSYEAVSPLLSTTWSQGTYYNDWCPLDYRGPDGHVLVGCCAVAVGQVLRYHNWPVTGSGTHGYTHPTYGYQYANFGATTYNWSSMPNKLTNYDDDVAQFLYHVGVSQDINYGPYFTGCSAATIDNFYPYFKYKPVTHVSRSSYSDTVWAGKLKADLDAGRPVVYTGYNPSGGGHAFVCDGYQGTGSYSSYFHFNWGWNGSYDGYFYLWDLTPGSSNWTSGQGAIFKITPDRPVGDKRAEIIGTWSNGIFYFYPPYWYSGQSKMHDETPDGAYPSGDIEAGDTNGDGVADVASCWGTYPGLRLQNGKTRGWETVFPYKAPYRVTMANVYGDARKEVIATWDTGVFYFYRTSSGWSYRQIADAKYVEPTADITAGDITGDGWDEVVSGYTTGTWIWFPKTNSWKRIAEPQYIIYNLACGDRDGDGRAEVIGGYNTGVWLWDGYWKQRLTDPGYVTKADMEMGDFNKNGRDDLVVAFSNPYGMYINYDNGTWYKAYDIPPYRVTTGHLIGD